MKRTSAILIVFGVTGGAIVLAVVGLIYWQRVSTINISDPYAKIPFRPTVTYYAAEVTITNPETEPYLNTSLHIYIDSTRFETQIGTIPPGESVKRVLSSLKNERGESFTPGAHGTSQLEVRARFGGYDVHKDFPPPP